MTSHDHIEPETLAAFVDGKLGEGEIARVLAHLDHCAGCRAGVELANQTLVEEETEEEESSPGAAGKPRLWWLAVAAVFAIGIVTLPAVRSWRAKQPMRQLVALAPEASRVVEPRLTGGFRWAAYRGPMRATGQAASREQLKLTAAAARVIDRAEDAATADAQHEAGVAYVMIQQPDVALERLRKVAAGDPQNARVWNDLAAAHYAAAEASGNDAGFADALTAADEALRIDPQLAEARFNRALVLERMGLAQQARAAWQRYLEVDPSSSWADEARQRLAKLTGSTGDSQFRDALPRLEQRKDVAAIVAQFPQQSRAWGEAESLGRWGEALQRGDAIEAARWLDLTRDIGDVLTATTGETLLRDAVRAVDTAGDSRRATLADASVHYRRGRIAYARQQPSAAEPDLRAAAARFGSSPMALVARYFAACTRFDQNGVPAAHAELQSLLAATPQTWVALGAQIRWQLALCSTVDGDWTAARTSLTAAQAAFRHLGERSNEGFIQTLLAQTLMTIGRPDEAWTARIRSFELLSREGRGDRLPSALLGTAAGEVAAGRGASAASLFRLAEEESRATANHHFLSDALVRHAMLDVQSGRHEDAARAVREAKDAASRLTDPRVREGQLNHVRFATAAVALRDDPRQAYELLTAAIEHYQANGTPWFLPECYLLRSRAGQRFGDTAAAARDLESGVAVLERHRVAFANGAIGTGVLDAGAALFEEALQLALDRGDLAGAFVYAERSRIQAAQETGTLASLQQKIGGSGALVLELIALPEELVTFAVTHDDVVVTRKTIAREALAQQTPAALYELVIRPIEPALGRAQSLVIVNEPRLDAVPFAMLYDARTRRHLVERVAIVMATSASALLAPRAFPIPRRAVVVTLPTGVAAGSRALPATAGDGSDLRVLYRETTELPPSRATFAAFRDAAEHADVVHLAGHTELQRGIGESALVFTNGERVSWTTIASAPIGKPAVVVLAACETLHAPRFSPSRVLSLGAGFLAAGADAVIGTLTPIPDADARELFHAVHQQLAAGTPPAEAVRHMQLQALAARRGTAWGSIALLTHSIPNRTKN